jgi:hypothetical protein
MAVDRFHDGVTRRLDAAADGFEAAATRQGLGGLAQLAVGALGALGGMAEGLWQVVRHPVQTVQGLATMLGHVPLSPTWLLRVARGGVTRALQEDRAFWQAAGAAVLAPYAQDWQAGRRWAVAGRAAVDVGTLVVGAQRAAVSLGRLKGVRVAAAADELGLVSRSMGSGTRLTGQVLGEGQLVVQAPRRVLLRRAGAGIIVDRRRFRALAHVGPRRLASDAVIKRRFRTLTRSVDARMDDQLSRLLGVRPEGVPKDPVRAAGKLRTWQATDGSGVRLGHLDDLARGRIDLPSLEPARLRGMMDAIRRHFGDDNLIVRDHVVGQPFYRGRLHVKIRDASGLWYELQVGPRQLTQFFDTPFKAAGTTTSLHDAVYKGLLRLDDAAYKALGGGDATAGVERVARVVNRYVDEVDEVVSLARRGEPYDFLARTPELRADVAALLEDLPRPLWPEALR